jgi:Bacterial Ig-like domain
MDAKSRWRAHRVYLGLALAVTLTLCVLPVAGASAALVMESFPASRTSNTTPAFAGSTLDGVDPVTVNIYEGDTASGEPVQAPRGAPAADSWSAIVAAPLKDGTYTARAEQTEVGGFGHTDLSEAHTFTVDTRPPTVTLQPPAARSDDTAPSFSGTASDATQVTVEIFEGTRPEGPLVSTATALGAPGSWTSGNAAPALPAGEHTFTAVAVQPSELDNAPGRSEPVTFVVDTQPPALTLHQPPSVTSNTTPSFSGETNEATPVTVRIFKGAAAEGPVVATAAGTVSGERWTSSGALPALEDGTFTALAVQESAIGNPEAASDPVTFAVDTSSPRVTVNPLPSPSGDARPSFSGTASDTTPITVDIYPGGVTQGELAASITAEADHGRWASGRLTAPLEWGEYTAVARQPSSLGNPDGESSPVSFVVAPIPPGVVTEAAASVARSSVALYGSVDPGGSGVSDCKFEYGTTPGYGRAIECGFVAGLTAFPVAATAPVGVFVRIYGLSPSTTYHFRLVAVGEGGTGVGADQMFTTLPPLTFGEAGPPGPAASGTAAPSAGGTSAGRLAALLARQLKPRGAAARIAALLRKGLLSTRLTVPEPGRAVIVWYYQPPRARGARRARAPMLLASGKLSLRAAGTATLKIHLTGAGWRTLARASRIRLTARCAFTPPAGTTVRTAATFELLR